MVDRGLPGGHYFPSQKHYTTDYAPECSLFGIIVRVWAIQGINKKGTGNAHFKTFPVPHYSLVSNVIIILSIAQRKVNYACGCNLQPHPQWRQRQFDCHYQSRH
jgi:hypothetical protein